MNLPVLKLEPILKEKVWGGRRLAGLGKPLPASGSFGESWELADLASTSADGGGGDAARTRIADGPLAGKSIGDLLTEHRDELAGELPLTPEGAFPLLVKHLDAAANLSVQVHPSPAYAAAHPEAHLKTESWFVIDAEPGAVIYKGVRPGVDADRFRGAIADGSLVKLLNAVEVAAGDTHHLPSGTVHALGAGVLVAEVQTPSDTTFRVFDWGRQGRTLHVEQALACIDFSGGERLGPIRPGGAGHLVETPFYAFAHRAVDAGRTLDVGALGQRPRVLMCLAGAARLAWDGGTLDAARGDTLLVPARREDASLDVIEPVSMLDITFPG